MIAQTLDEVMKVWAESSLPTIRPKLYQGQNRKWHIRLIEEFASVDDAGNHYNSSKLDERINWALQTLETWKTAHRTAWDMWYFNSKRDAEKFITVYYLVWEK